MKLNDALGGLLTYKLAGEDAVRRTRQRTYPQPGLVLATAYLHGRCGVTMVLVLVASMPACCAEQAPVWSLSRTSQPATA